MRGLAAFLLALLAPLLARAQSQGQGPFRSPYPLEEGSTASWMWWLVALAAIVLFLLVLGRTRDRTRGRPPG